jgi:hypothetical protein
MVINGEEYVTVAAAAEQFSRPPTTISDWIGKHHLLRAYHRKTSKRPRYIKVADLQRLLDGAMVPLDDAQGETEELELEG